MKEELIKSAFSEAIKLHQYSFAYQIFILHQSTLYSNSDTIVFSILEELDGDPFQMEIKLSFFKSFMLRIRSTHIDKLISAVGNLVARIDQPYGILVCNINPLMVSMQLLEITKELTQKFPLVKMRLVQIEESIKTNLIKILDNYYAPRVIKSLLLMSDLHGYTVLDKLG